MGRWRPPAEKSSPYITAKGHKLLLQELDDIWKRRREVAKHLAAAAAEGDRSENAEYIYRKKELRELDRRIRYLQKRIPELKVVSEVPGDHSRVYFGAWVTLANETDDKNQHCRIVGFDEISMNSQYISVDSPLAKALLGKSLSQEIEVITPSNELRYTITDIKYDNGGNDSQA